MVGCVFVSDLLDVAVLALFRFCVDVVRAVLVVKFIFHYEMLSL